MRHLIYLAVGVCATALVLVFSYGAGSLIITMLPGTMLPGMRELDAGEKVSVGFLSATIAITFAVSFYLFGKLIVSGLTGKGWWFNDGSSPYRP